MKLNQAKNTGNITSSIQGLLGKDSELKYLAQRAVVSYLRSIYLQVRVGPFPNPASLFAHTRTRRDVLPLLGRLTSALTVCAYIAIYKTDTFFYSS